jgi:TusE/DsrC/DsvC family sulfur relay protein
MTTREIAGKEIEFDDEGFMTNPGEWSEDVAAELAKVIGIDLLNEDHWKVIKYSRQSFTETGEAPTLRRINTEAGVAIKALYKLFPKKPAKKVAFVSGLQKPTGCI